MFECAAEPSVLAGYGESPAYVINTNLGGTLNCLEVLRKHRADVVFLSTSRVYPTAAINALDYVELDTRFDLKPHQKTEGASQEGIAETFPLHGGRSIYGATKLASEILLEEYLDAYDIRGVVNRCGVLTGPWQMGKVDQGFVVLWVAKHFFEKELAYFGYGGTGKQVRDILHIDDLYALLVKQLDRLDSISGTVYNVGGGRDVSTSLAELTTLCTEVTGKSIHIASVDEDRQADLRYYVSDCHKVRSALNWAPQKSVRETIIEVEEWIRLNQSSLEPILA
jgi:CDP-paratose 2-epimerase